MSSSQSTVIAAICGAVFISYKYISQKMEESAVEQECKDAMIKFINSCESTDDLEEKKKAIDEWRTTFMQLMQNKIARKMIARAGTGNGSIDCELDKLFLKVMDHWNDKQFIFEYIINKIFSKNKNKKDWRLLEIGSGGGELIERLIKYSTENGDNIQFIQALEIGEASVIFLKNRFKQTIKPRISVNKFDICDEFISSENIQTMNLKNGSFDVIITINSFYYWKNTEIAGKNIYNLLSKNGKLFGAHAGFKKPSKIFKNGTEELYLKMLENSGFQMNTIDMVKEESLGFSDIICVTK